MTVLDRRLVDELVARACPDACHDDADTAAADAALVRRTLAALPSSRWARTAVGEGLERLRRQLWERGEDLQDATDEDLVDVVLDALAGRT